jgi:Bacterial Ig-like domain
MTATPTRCFTAVKTVTVISVSFSTVPDAAPPSVLGNFPIDDATNVPLGTLIQISFDDEMDAVSTLAAVSSSLPLGCIWELTNAKDRLRCSPSNLQANTTYTITVSTEAKDTSGKNLCLGRCLDELTRSYIFKFSTIVTATVGELRVTISGAPDNLARVSVTGPNGYSSGNLDSSRTLSDLEPSAYTVTAQSFSTNLNKPTCKMYTPTPALQIETVSAGQTASATITYQEEKCDSDDAP